MIEIKRTTTERHTIPGSVFKKKLGLPSGSMRALFKDGASIDITRWDGRVAFGSVVLEITRIEHLSRKNR